MNLVAVLMTRYNGWAINGFDCDVDNDDELCDKIETVCDELATMSVKFADEDGEVGALSSTFIEQVKELVAKRFDVTDVGFERDEYSS
jgi:hypothetical protein